MKRATETRAKPLGLVVLAVSLAVLSGCDEALLNSGPSSAANDESSESDSKTELLPLVSGGAQRDVEAPDVFEVTEAGLWDGRPSLGGIWVAHPDAKHPERVVIKNTANNKSVTGALFRRERNLPGPALQVSSAAADKLGMLAGAPTKVYVVALRRETIEEKPAEPEEAAVAADTSKEPASDTAGTASDAEKATEAAEPKAEKPAKRKWWQKKEPAAVATAGAAGAAAVATDEATDAITETTVQATGSPPGLTDAPVAAPPEKPAKRKWWQKKNPDEITETTLDPIAGAAAAIEATEPTPTAASGTAAATSLTKPYVQVGTFGVEANANSAAEKIRRNGMSADVRELKTGDKSVWRVLVGPASTRAERKAIQGDVKDLGFTDAFVVKN